MDRSVETIIRDNRGRIKPGEIIVVEQKSGIDAGSWGGILSLGAKLRGVAGDYRKIFACFKLDLDRFWKRVFQYFDDLFDEMARLKRYPFAFDPSGERKYLFDKTRSALICSIASNLCPSSSVILACNN